MSTMSYNRSFKPPPGPAPPRRRSPSPPRAFVEPLSPTRPAPIEPNFNYPALSNSLRYNTASESSHATPPKARAYSTNDKSGSHHHNQHRHQRTPSTIDTLAEAALATSGSHHNHSRKSSTTNAPNTYSHAHPPQQSYIASEPPHKRTRSELLPSPQVGFQTSRPATSYQPNAWPHTGQSGHGFNSRVEEAALLLNFQSGGWPNASPGLDVPPAPAPRPHANSFPQDGFQIRPAEATAHPQSSLLPPFNPQESHQPPPPLPSPPQAVAAPRFPQTAIEDNTNGDVKMPDVQTDAAPTNVAVEQDPTPPADTTLRRQSAEITSEASDAPKSRRGWPKGKPRGSNSKKTMAEKAASKRAASRKKTPESKASRSKTEGAAMESTQIGQRRRKSLSDAFVFGERETRLDAAPVVPRGKSVSIDTPMTIRDASSSKPTRRKGDVRPETICAGCQTSRKTANSHGEFDEWISCNGCKKWFHIDCAGFKKAHDIRDVDKFFCNPCEPTHGKTTYVRKSARAHASVDYAELQKGVLKTSEESMEHHYIQPIKDGTFQFDPEMFPRIRPEMVTRDFFEKSGLFVEPICIPAEWNPRPWAKAEQKQGDETSEPTWDGDTVLEAFPSDYEYDTVPDLGQDKLEMVMPRHLTVRNVCNLVGGDWPIDVIDVKTQNSGAKWTLNRWADYYEELGDEKAIRNVISLEVSQTRLGRLLQRPKIVRDIDLQDDVWPQEETDKGKYPKVQFYCLMSVADSYTDFHIDFGGSSVYYHILKGKKTFFFIPPKAKHLKAYEEWNDSPQQNYTFLPSITKECYRVDLHEGDTMLIPSGWIHAVWTPADSLVIGGNFLNRLSFKNQFKVVEIEKANETPMKFRYPHFQKVMWYTAIKYLKTDPLPSAVSQLFYEGQRFERELPVWADFDGDIAENDPRPGAHNARYYSQAEIDGLPDLVNFIFRTVMLVTGRIEGISADRMKRVNASIPKGHGEPLEVAKTFALWVAWKRGNEDPPAWAHPDAVLPSSKDEGPPKKLSERKLKELERKEAIAAWRVAPDRQSVRVMAKNATAAAAAATSDNNHPNNNATSSPAPAQQQNHHIQMPYYQNETHAPPQPSSAPPPPPPPPPPPAAFIMPAMTASHLSTPKTSVLGPKRVACDACRKRRIRCKHKDMVTQTDGYGMPQTTPDGTGSFESPAPADVHENITVTPPKHHEDQFVNTGVNGQQQASYLPSAGPQPNGDSTPHGGPPANGHGPTNGQGPFPGTNAYINANIPMTMNGVPIFGEVPKRGRSKACYECRKSKRRCIHDESGNVDPVKASETPVPRGSITTKKRPLAEDGSPLQVKKQKTQPDYIQPHNPMQHSHQPHMQGHGVLKPQPPSNGRTIQPRMSSANGGHEQHQPQGRPVQLKQEQQPPIDPSLFAMYPEPGQDASYGESQYPYQAAEQLQHFNQPQSAYQIPSLEQIANEVLVDMNGNEYQDPTQAQQYDINERLRAHLAPETLPQTNGEAKADKSVDSAVSLSKADGVEQRPPDAAQPNELPKQDDGAPLPDDVRQESIPAHPSIETAAARTNGEPTSPPTATTTASNGTNNNVNNIPLYKPPAPLSRSPETTKRQPAMPNGLTNGKSSSPTDTTPLERKRDSISTTPAAKKAKMDAEGGGADEPTVPLTAEESRSLELAKALQQQDMGLRRRSK